MSKRADGWCVKLALGLQVELSRPQGGQPLPVWNETFEYTVADEGRETLNITLLDEADSALGLYCLRFDNMVTGVRQEVIATLLVKGADGKWASRDPPDRVVLALTAIGFGRKRDEKTRAAPTPQSFSVVGYTAEFKDKLGRSPGMAGFIPPVIGNVQELRPLEPGCYDQNYVDSAGRRPGDAGFVPPLTGVADPGKKARKAAGLPTGFDDDYRDASGLAPGMPGFIPPARGQQAVWYRFC